MGSVLAPYDLKVAKRHLAACTYDDTHGLLKAGIVSRHFEDVFVEEIDKAKLAAFWKAAVTDRKRAPKTGRNYLNAISAVLSLCVDEGIIDINPVSAFRRSATVQTGSRTKKAREADQAGSKARPIETAEGVAALVAAADAYRHEGSRITKIRGKTVEASLRETEKLSRQKAYVCVLLLLDAGLRLGEAIALRWKDVVFDSADGRLIVRKSFSRGKHMGVPRRAGGSVRSSSRRACGRFSSSGGASAGRPKTTTGSSNSTRATSGTVISSRS
jgi:integrase